MKKSSLAVPVSMTMALACLVSLNLSCRKKAEPADLPTALPPPTETNAASAPTPATNADVIAPAPAPEPASTNPPPVAAEPVTPPATPEPAPTAPIAPEPVHTIVEMPTTVPVAPTNFYSDDYFSRKTNGCALAKNDSKTESDYFLLFRAGYQHVNHGDNNDTYYLSVKLGLNGDQLRERAGKSAWLVPDAYAELSHQYLPKPDDSPAPGSGEGIQFRANFYWPWMHWTSRMFVRTNGADETYLPLRFTLGPTANIGFDQLFDGSEARLARYAGLRATLNHGFLEYTVGGTDGLAGVRNQVLTEVPFYVSSRNHVRYYFRGLWNTGYNSTHDELEAGLFVELPFDTLLSPSKWGSLVPGLE